MYFTIMREGRSLPTTQVFHTDRTCADATSDSLTQAVTISDMAGLFLFSGCLCVVALLVAVVQYMDPSTMSLAMMGKVSPYQTGGGKNKTKLEAWGTVSPRDTGDGEHDSRLESWGTTDDVEPQHTSEL